jgi:hypothetical protein
MSTAAQDVLHDEGIRVVRVSVACSRSPPASGLLPRPETKFPENPPGIREHWAFV